MSDSPGPQSWPLEPYREYLRLLARMQFGPALRARLDESDVVQEAMLRADTNAAEFRGTTRVEWEAYLRRILASALADAARRHARGKRDVALERSLDAALGESSARVEAWLAGPATPPSERAQRGEMLVRLAAALAELPEAQRLALELRYLNQPPCSLADIAVQLGRTEKAAAGLLCRGLEQLRTLLQDDP